MTARGPASSEHYQNPIQHRPPVFNSSQNASNVSISLCNNTMTRSSSAPTASKVVDVAALRISLDALRTSRTGSIVITAKSPPHISELALSPINTEQAVRNRKRQSRVLRHAPHLSVAQCPTNCTRGTHSVSGRSNPPNRRQNSAQNDEDEMDDDDDDALCTPRSYRLNLSKLSLTPSTSNASSRICSPGIHHSKSCGAQPKQYVYSYTTWSRARVIKMSKHLTRNVIPQRIKECVVDCYDFINKVTAIALYDGHFLDVGDDMILNYGFHDRNTNHVLYLVAAKGRNRLYHMEDQMYTKREICHRYKLQERQLPNAPFNPDLRDTVHQMDCMFNVDYRSVQWHKLPVFRAMNNNKEATKYNKQRLTFLITKTEFIKTAAHRHTLIPIIMFNCSGYRMEYIQIMRIGNGIDIGVSYFYNHRRKCFQATAIHLNRENMLRQHQLADPHHECHCLDDFVSMIDDLHIGNPDDDKNRVKDLQKKNAILKDEHTRAQQVQQMLQTNVSHLQCENQQLKMENARVTQTMQALQIERDFLLKTVLQTPIASPPSTSITCATPSFSSTSSQFRVPSLSLPTPATPAASIAGHFPPQPTLPMRNRSRTRSNATPVSGIVVIPFSEYPNVARGLCSAPQSMNNNNMNHNNNNTHYNAPIVESPPISDHSNDSNPKNNSTE